MTDSFLCGWRVRSDLHLPELAPWSGDDRKPDVVIRIGEVPDRLDDPVECGPFLQIDRRGTCLLRLDSVAAYLVTGPSEVIVSPRPGAAGVEVRVFLLGSVLGLICHQRELLPLHASCVAIDNKAVALCGRSGVGKSTAAAQLALRGHRLLADDVCVIDTLGPGGPYVLPAFPRLKLWADTLVALGIPSDGLERNRPGQNKYHYLHAEAFPTTPIRLGGIFLLRTAWPGTPEENVRVTRPAQKIGALDREGFRLQAASALGRNSFFAQGAIGYCRIDADLAAVAPPRSFEYRSMDRANRGGLGIMSGLVILASYPKSGSTWMRAVLASLARGGRPLNINTELVAHSLTWRDACDSWIGLETSDLTAAEVAMVRPYISRRAAQAIQPIVKAHDANLVPPGGREPPYPADSIDRVIYIVRDPRDVVVSCVHHFVKPIETVVAEMNDPAFGVGYSKFGLSNNVPEHFSTWSRHVESWLDAPDLRVHCVRYEDMAAEGTIAAVAEFLELDHTPEEIAGAMQAASFQNLAEQEACTGFREISPFADAPFFRRGKAGTWHLELPPALAEQIVHDHAPVMRRLGYLG